MASEAFPATPQTPGHRRTKTSILKSIVSPTKTHKKSYSAVENHIDIGDSNPLNTYMRNPNTVPPQLPPLDLDPPVAPFAQEDRNKRMHRKSFSSISLKSFKSGKKDADMSTPSSPVQTSGGFSDKLRDLASLNRGVQPNDLDKTPKKPTKSKSALDIGMLRRKDKKQKDGKENEHPRGDAPMDLGAPGPAFYGDDGGYRSSGDGLGLGLVLPRDSSPARASLPRCSTDGSFVQSRFQEDVRLRHTRTEELRPGERSPSRQGKSRIPQPEKRDPSPGKKVKTRPKSAYLPSTSLFHGGLSSMTSPRKSVDRGRGHDAPKLGRANSQKSVHSNKSSNSDLNRALANGGIDALNREFEELLVGYHVSKP